MASSRIDLSTRLSSVHASRGEKRIYLAPATTTSTSEAPPPTTARARPVVVKKKTTTTTTAKPKPTAKSQPKPATASSTTPTTSNRPMPQGGGNTNHQDGNASWYDASYQANNPWICAHRTLPMGTVITVTAVATGKSITCEVGDRGPYAGNDRILDLSKYAFSQLANPSSGVVQVHLSW